MTCLGDTHLNTDGSKMSVCHSVLLVSVLHLTRSNTTYYHTGKKTGYNLWYNPDYSIGTTLHFVSSVNNTSERTRMAFFKASVQYVHVPTSLDQVKETNKECYHDYTETQHQWTIIAYST